MKTAGLMMTTLMASAMGAVTNVVVNDVVTCNADTDCRQHGDTTATCATTGKCTCTAGGNHAVYGTGNNALNLCRPNTNPPANPKVTLYYLLRNIDATNKAVNCDNAGTFTAPYDTLIKGQATTTKGFETVEIVHLCHKSTAGVHTLRTSIKTQVSITNLVSATATTSDPFKTLISDINTALGASTNTALASVGTIDSAETIASTGLGRFCDTTLTHVTAPFVAAPTTTKANNQCKAVSCAKGYSFDKAAATPTCSGPGAFASSNILTCGTATDCAKYGQTGACDATTKKCTAAGTTCVHFSVGTNTLAQCNEAAAPAATDKITLYYILRHGTMTGDSTKAVDCTKESEFTTPYDALIKTAAGFSATELTTVSIVHHCTGTSTLATSIKFEVTVSDLLTNTNSKYSEIANNINDALIQSTDAKLKAVGAVSTVKVGSSEAYTGLCPASGTGEAMQVPMGTNELSTVAGTRDCQAVECSTGYFLSDAEVCTVNTPSPVATATPGTTTGTFAIAVSFDVTGELSTIGTGRTAITSTVASGLGSTTATTVCNRVCLTSSGTGTCWTCEAAASATTARSGSVLAAQRYTMHYTGLTSLTTALARTSLENVLSTYFALTAGISYHANSVIADYYDTSSDDGLSGGAIAGIVIGCVVFVVIVVVLIYCLCCKKAPESDAASSSSSDKKAGAPDEA